MSPDRVRDGSMRPAPPSRSTARWFARGYTVADDRGVHIDETQIAGDPHGRTTVTEHSRRTFPPTWSDPETGVRSCGRPPRWYVGSGDRRDRAEAAAEEEVDLPRPPREQEQMSLPGLW